MKVIEIRSENDFRGLKEGWDRLVAESASATIFLTWDWISAWWSAYRGKRELNVWAAVDERGNLRGLAPLCRRKIRRKGQAVETLSFLGDGTNDSDYLDFIARAGDEECVLEGFRARWDTELDRGTVLLLNEIPESSPNLSTLLRAGAGARRISVVQNVGCATVRLPDSWESYLGILKPRFRTKVRSVLRALEARPEVRFGFCDNAAQLETLLPVLFDLHRRRWAQAGKPGVFGWDLKRRFYIELSERLLANAALRFSWLEWNGRILACQYGFVYGATYSQLQEGYEPATEHWNPGVGLRAWSIRELMNQGVREYDFLSGLGRHKSDWGGETKYSKRLEIAGDTWKNVVFCRGADWEQALKDYVKRFVPNRVLALRNGTSQDAAGKPARAVLQKVAANCYFYAGLPALVRPVRERYQLGSRTAADPGKSACQRRTKPSARIFCYHRVNDDNDPFLPATSTDLFEEHIRFVSRHYCPVSLGEMLRRLDEPPGKSLVALTFDDGYRDNFENAFPILQRYGVPATIFLTTGNIDSGEALWFEELAVALKKTAREFIDLEIDVPRRFWLRTASEKLEASNRIVAMLRLLPDTARREWLAHIFRELGGTAGPLKDRMLTWEQIRRMSTQGIHFGGHTVTHPFLSKLTSEQAVWEVSECKRRIQDEIQSSVDYFAYPNGGEEDVAPWNKELVRSVGYRAAVTTVWGINENTTDPMSLKRGGPWETDPALFAYKLDWYNFLNA